MITKIKKYIDGLNDEQLIKMLQTFKDIDEYLDKNYIGTEPINRNDEIECYIKQKLHKNI